MIHKEVVWTADGSPTYFLREASGTDLPGGRGQGEAMHNSLGAYSETQYIYGPVVEGCFEMASADDSVRGPHFLSVGLGLGYNELLIASNALGFLGEWTCVSYESEDFLKKDLLDYVYEREMTEEKALVYEAITLRFAEGLLCESSGAKFDTVARLRAELRNAHADGRWILEPALCLKSSTPPRKIHGFLWDAFSRKTSPTLWEKEALTGFLNRHRAPQALFSTYASFVDLRSALNGAGFKAEIRQGFAGKRESCFARA